MIVFFAQYARTSYLLLKLNFTIQFYHSKQISDYSTPFAEDAQIDGKSLVVKLFFAQNIQIKASTFIFAEDAKYVHFHGANFAHISLDSQKSLFMFTFKNRRNHCSRSNSNRCNCSQIGPEKVASAGFCKNLRFSCALTHTKALQGHPQAPSKRTVSGHRAKRTNEVRELSSARRAQEPGTGDQRSPEGGMKCSPTKIRHHSAAKEAESAPKGQISGCLQPKSGLHHWTDHKCFVDYFCHLISFFCDLRL